MSVWHVLQRCSQHSGRGSASAESLAAPGCGGVRVSVQRFRRSRRFRWANCWGCQTLSHKLLMWLRNGCSGVKNYHCDCCGAGLTPPSSVDVRLTLFLSLIVHATTYGHRKIGRPGGSQLQTCAPSGGRVVHARFTPSYGILSCILRFVS